MPSLATALNPLASQRQTVIMRADFTAIENFMRDMKGSVERVQQGGDLLVRTMALVILGYAQQKSGGPVAPGKRSVPSLANRIPVQRITGAYFAGWKTKRLGLMSWLVYNDSKEAYLIETGMYQRVRRPILKMSVIAMLKFLENSRTELRFLDSVIAPRRNELGQFASIPLPKRLMGTETLNIGNEVTEEIHGTSTRDAFGNARKAPVTRITRRRF